MKVSVTQLDILDIMHVLLDKNIKVSHKYHKDKLAKKPCVRVVLSNNSIILTHKQFACLICIATGRGAKHTAYVLGCSNSTLIYHLKRNKVEACSRL